MNTTPHLTSEQMDAVLSRTADREVQQHLSDCGQCADEVNSLRSIFSEIRLSSAALAERKYAAAPLAMLPKSPRRSRVAWALATAACAALLALLPMHPKHAVDIPASRAQSSSQMLTDEALLNDIQNDLTDNVPDVMKPLAASDSDNQISSRKN